MNAPFTYTADGVTVHPPTSPSSGPDRRVRIGDAEDHQFHRSIVARQEPMGVSTTVETQAFTPDGFGRSIVALVMYVAMGENNLAGQADTLLSPAEARRVARILIVAADEAETLDESARQAQVA